MNAVERLTSLCAPANWPGRVKPFRSFYLTGPRTVNDYYRPHSEFKAGGADGLKTRRLLAARKIN
jgi:hypothetical protein